MEQVPQEQVEEFIAYGNLYDLKKMKSYMIVCEYKARWK